jgi:hypothetical protein
MKKNIDPEQVKDGKVACTFETFLGELWKDVESSFSKDNSIENSDRRQPDESYQKNLKDVFAFVYELCYLSAINHPKLKGMLKKMDDENKGIVQNTLKFHEENIALLRAIFWKEISDKLERGLSKRQAVKATIEQSKSAFHNWRT